MSLDIPKELLTYYKRGIHEDDPSIRFLAFYHIFEYFFKIIYGEFKNETKIIAPEKFRGSEEDFKSILFNNRLNEKNALQLVFQKYLRKEWIVEELNYRDTNNYSYLKDNRVEFANAPIINDEKFYETAALRVYAIRNAIVHRKEGNNLSKYLPYEKEHRTELKKELLFMKILSEHILIKSSKML